MHLTYGRGGLCSTAYHMVNARLGDHMFRGLKDALAEYLRAEAARLAAVPDDAYLPALRRVWARHKAALPLVRDVLLFMVRPWSFGHTERERGTYARRQRERCKTHIQIPSYG
jgi:hypothetical protein